MRLQSSANRCSLKQMFDEPAKREQAPEVWADGMSPGVDEAPRSGQQPPPVGFLERRLGFPSAHLAPLTWLPDEATALSIALADDTPASGGQPFHGAYVPLVLHDPPLAERSYDAAEWAAELVRAEGGHRLAIAPFADRSLAAGTPLSPRAWNHAVAMVERLEELCHRFGLAPVVNDVVVDTETGAEMAEPADAAAVGDRQVTIHHAMDVGGFVADGYVSAVLIRPQAVDLDTRTAIGRLRAVGSGVPDEEV